MGKINKLIHLEHLEDEMLNTGVEGCEKIVMDMVETVSYTHLTLPTKA